MRNIQVALAGGPSAEFSLEDAEGRFLTVPAAEEDTPCEPSEPSKYDPEQKPEPDTL